MAYMGKIRSYRKAEDVSAEWKMSRFMLSGRGYYNGDVRMMVLSCRDHAVDYPIGSEKWNFWVEVARILDAEGGR